MSVTSQPIRRTLTIALAVAALLLGLMAIRAAAAWTVEAAPLVASPASAQKIVAALSDEQARSAALQDQLMALAGQTEVMTAALEAAEARIVSDAEHAEELAKDLAAATKKLKALERSIQAAAVASARAPKATTTSRGAEEKPKHELEDEHELED